MKKILLLFTLLPIFNFGQTTAIPDSVFEQELIDLGYDTGAPNGSVLTVNIIGVTNLNLTYNNITDLTGIEDFTALTYLYCTSNQLTSLDISNNTALESLECGGNQLTTLDVSNNTALINLVCSYNQLTSLEMGNITFLENLWCSYNQLTSLDLSNNTALTSLQCHNNLLTCLNIKNGNNTNLINLNSFRAMNNPNLNCIQADDSAWATLNLTYIDSQTTFSNNCNYPASCWSTSSYIQENTTKTSLFPNPANDLITLAIKNYNGSFNVEIYDLQGRLLESTKSKTISIKKYSKGLYIFRVSYANKSEELRVLRN